MTSKPVPTTEQALALARYWAGDEQPGDAAVVTRFEVGGKSEGEYIAGALARWTLRVAHIVLAVHEVDQ